MFLCYFRIERTLLRNVTLGYVHGRFPWQPDNDSRSLPPPVPPLRRRGGKPGSGAASGNGELLGDELTVLMQMQITMV